MRIQSASLYQETRHIAAEQVVELKEELSKRGIAPGRRKKAELLQALQEALLQNHDEAQEPQSGQLANVPDVARTGTSSRSNSTNMKRVQCNNFQGRPRRINFVDIESLDDEDQVTPFDLWSPVRVPWYPISHFLLQISEPGKQPLRRPNVISDI